MTSSLIIIPTYKEVENIGLMIPAVLDQDPSYALLIVDDGSPDGTADAVRGLMKQYPDRLHLLERPGKQGLGTAYILGFRWALERGYSFVLEMDADFSHDPKDLPRLIKACSEGADVSVGSRYVKGGRVENWPADRVLISKGASIYVRLITWMPVRDTTAGFVCYKREVLEAIDLDKIRFIGYAFQIEMKYAAWRSGFRIREIPITFKDRVKGSSKMSKGIVKEAALGVLSIRWKSLFHAYRK
ncbi:MAG: polyprenol monophosphomannose synthase [Chitinophagales bacterium]|nr:polyprenol monophosphomannose synthase [Chitinophagales bacterium]HAE13645.1 dolichyl-phosphate beta-D-mannosyltransferase [Bacteroidota bacterium]MCB9031029.1 polyprenol monophosphomannose synthase [Chitinophagales bacterium]HAE34253.1 dolichyl-phosphate beta-D-mannosyltransferase [Bacteroidota bacterium]HPE96417.1 polyprenol monophosphomannose synthase [Chitinophagales bacterium]